MVVKEDPERAFARVERNPTAGRDFVVGDVHGEFDTLEAMLANVGFLPGRDRLFALGDLVDRGPRSVDALAWMESGRIALSVRGNHEQMLLERMEATESDREGRTARTAHPWWMAHPWFARDVERTSWGHWKAMIRSMPFAATVSTHAGPVGLVHASPTTRCWGWATTIVLAMSWCSFSRRASADSMTCQSRMFFSSNVSETDIPRRSRWS